MTKTNMENLKGTTFLVLCICMVWQAHGAVNCTAEGAGRHADPADTTCRTYVYCIFNTVNNSFVSYIYTCPTTSLFNPNSARCTAATNYNCTAAGSNAASSLCTVDGFIADPNSPNCNSYIQCTQVNGAFVETTLQCPAGTFYNPATTLCESNYICPSATTTTFACTAPGRFANTADTTCQTYFLCVFISTNSTYVQNQYTCPTTSLFSPNSRLCTTSYTCGA